MSANSDQKVSLLALSGVSGSGKSVVLRDIADSLGFSFESFDCLAYFNLPSIKRLFSEIIPDTCNTAALLIELTNFDKYRMLVDQFSQGSSKGKRDLTEMRFIQTFQHALQSLEAKIQGQRHARVVIVASCEKQSDVMESFNRLFREKFVIKNPEKQDREEIIRWLLENDEKLATLGEEASRSLDAEAIGKYLQGKCFKEIRSILVKITRGVEKLENA